MFLTNGCNGENRHLAIIRWSGVTEGDLCGTILPQEWKYMPMIKQRSFGEGVKNKDRERKDGKTQSPPNQVGGLRS